ncbi:MAG TPA: hypothetical protein VHT73_04280 [Thermodesulfobacteriota bacterium]|nr:hypothetical protein [Thermodesulfobacteriota bacterium]
MKWRILFFIFLLGLSGCAGVSDVSESHSIRNRPGTSPTKVVADFLEALKEDDFGKAYEFVYAPFSDKDGYVLRMKNLVKDYNVSILDYRILGSQILGDTAIVVAELETKLKPHNSNTEILKKRRNQYNLSIMEDKWRITSEKCILNCTTAEDLAGRAEY